MKIDMDNDIYRCDICDNTYKYYQGIYEDGRTHLNREEYLNSAPHEKPSFYNFNSIQTRSLDVFGDDEYEQSGRGHYSLDLCPRCAYKLLNKIKGATDDYGQNR